MIEFAGAAEAVDSKPIANLVPYLSLSIDHNAGVGEGRGRKERVNEAHVALRHGFLRTFWQSCKKSLETHRHPVKSMWTLCTGINSTCKTGIEFLRKLTESDVLPFRVKWKRFHQETFKDPEGKEVHPLTNRLYQCNETIPFTKPPTPACSCKVCQRPNCTQSDPNSMTDMMPKPKS